MAGPTKRPNNNPKVKRTKPDPSTKGAQQYTRHGYELSSTLTDRISSKGFGGSEERRAKAVVGARVGTMRQMANRKNTRTETRFNPGSYTYGQRSTRGSKKK